RRAPTRRRHGAPSGGRSNFTRTRRGGAGERRGKRGRQPPGPPAAGVASSSSSSSSSSVSDGQNGVEEAGTSWRKLDDRLAELLSDDDDDGGVYGEGGFDYELETAKRAGSASEAAAAGEGTVEGMRERLQAETERSLGVLAAIFGGGSGNATAGGAPPPPRGAVGSLSTPATSGAESRGPESGTVV
ncbi:unnamed protein product, partial [Ectocarpus sp. 12 AP-2014]